MGGRALPPDSESFVVQGLHRHGPTPEITSMQVDWHLLKQDLLWVADLLSDACYLAAISCACQELLLLIDALLTSCLLEVDVDQFFAR